MNKRKSNFELLRIVCMYMIIVHHILVYGGALDLLDVNEVNYWIANFINSITIIAVNVYVMISGYFMIDNVINYKKIFNLYTTIIFYSITISGISWILKIEDFSLIAVFKSIFPILTFQWWFVSYYIVLYIFSPYINKLLNSLNEEEFRKIVILLLVIFVAWPTFSTFIGTINPASTRTGYDLFNFIVLYIIGAYIKKYEPKINKSKKYIYIVSTLLLFIINIVVSKVNNMYADIYNYNFILVYISSISLFLIFLDIDIKSNRINKIASLTFGVYLIHEQRCVRSIIYSLLGCTNAIHNSDFILNIIISSSIIFICAMFIENIRKVIFNCINLKFYKKTN